MSATITATLMQVLDWVIAVFEKLMTYEIFQIIILVPIAMYMILFVIGMIKGINN